MRVYTALEEVTSGDVRFGFVRCRQCGKDAPVKFFKGSSLGFVSNTLRHYGWRLKGVDGLSAFCPTCRG